MITVALLIIAWTADTATGRRHAARAEAAGPSSIPPGEGFPVPPLDLPHYHGTHLAPLTPASPGQAGDAAG